MDDLMNYLMEDIDFYGDEDEHYEQEAVDEDEYEDYGLTCRFGCGRIVSEAFEACDSPDCRQMMLETNPEYALLEQ
jgi:hypothetical protein